MRAREQAVRSPGHELEKSSSTRGNSVAFAPTMLTDLRYSIAIHESGHALVGLSCGLHIFGMYIHPDDKSSGTKFRHEDFSRLTLDDQVTVTLAGAEAVQIVGCEHLSGQAMEDHHLVRATLLRHGIDENTAQGSARGKSIRKNARV